MFRRIARQRLAIAVLVLIALASSCLAANAPKNIILLIGDGMGVGPVSAARVAGPGRAGRLAMDTMPYTGFAITYSANALVTDSAAAATALSTGVKTNNGTVGLDPAGKRLKTMLEAAKSMGKSTAVVSTKFITDATPAAFVAHVTSRASNDDIAAQMVTSAADVILGGGRQYFASKANGGARKDDRDLLTEAKKSGYNVVDSAEAMTKSASPKLIGLFAPNVMTSDRPEPTVAEMTVKAISILSKNTKGFFMMSEGGKIDTMGHANNAEGSVKETLMFDDAVRAALAFAKKDGHTLVVVTADHDTGGLVVREPNKDDQKFNPGWVYNGHDENLVPIYAYGPGAENFTGTHDNTEIPKIMAKLWKQKLN